jgi:Zn-dependent protease with chaperone function
MAPPSTTAERREHFEALVCKAERLIVESPRAYKVRIGALAMLGYAVIFGVMFILVGLLGGTLWMALASTALFLLLLKKKMIVVLAILVWVLLKALWVRFARPQGIAVTRAQAPALFDEIDEVAAALDLPRIHEVLLTDEFNAAMSQSPRLGVLGWQRNSLLLGVPLLLALSPQEMRAVIAHEAGHLSGNHSRFNAWIYRVRTTWYRIMEAFEESEGFGAGLMKRFFAWYAPYFDAMSFALARANEYEADAVAVQLTSRQAAASALVGASVRGEVASEEYWQPLYRRARDEPEPEAAPYRGLAQFHAQHQANPDMLRERISSEMSIATAHADTHPALQDRLAAIGAEPNNDFNVAPSAAQAWLGDALLPILLELDTEWVSRNTAAWRDHFQQTREDMAALDTLSVQPRDALEPLQLWRLASLTEQYLDEVAALALFREYAEREPQDPDADFAIGRLLLNRDDAAGVACMERAAGHFNLALSACENIHAYYLRVGDIDAARDWRLRGEGEIDLHNQARAERATVHKKDVYLPSELSPEYLAHLCEQLIKIKQVRRASIARKQVNINPQSPIYVIAITSKGLFTRNAKVIQTLVDDIEVPGECFFVARAGDTKAIAKKVAEHGEKIL